MPPRNPELPEGTDHIINGAMETGAGTDASIGSSGPTAGGGTAATGNSGFIGTGETRGMVDDTGGTAIGAGTDGSNGSTGSSSGGAPIKQQVRDGVQSLKQQATERVRTVAEDGKSRATTALDDLSRMVTDAADSIDEKLGNEYGQYARRAADAVTGLADTIRNKQVDDLFDDARQIVRKSPVLAIGAAAVVGFTLVRLIKAGMPDTEGGAGDVQFQPAGGKGIDFDPDTRLTGSTSGPGA